MRTKSRRVNIRNWLKTKSAAHDEYEKLSEKAYQMGADALTQVEKERLDELYAAGAYKWLGMPYRGK